MDNALLQIGVGGIFAILVIKSFIDFAKAMKKNGNGNGHDTVIDIKAVTIDTNDRVKGISALCSRTDGDGVPMVYTPRSMIKVQEEIAKCQALTAEHLKELSHAQERILNKLEGR